MESWYTGFNSKNDKEKGVDFSYTRFKEND